MDETRWTRIEEVFERAMLLVPPERDDFLARACGNDTVLRAEIQAMVAAATPGRALAIERLVPDDQPPGPDVIVGTELGRWRVLRVLGRGGMGTVYLAERADGLYQQQVALKVISPGAWRPDAAERFRNEREVLARLAHPNISRLLDGGFADGRPYFVMELVEGAPITDWCETHHLSVDERLRLFCVVCQAVQHAHAALVVHRDLKPANTFVSSRGEVKLLDFGIAKLLEPSDPAETIPVGDPSTALTPEYAAPEQLVGGPVTTATDVYTLGVLLHELLTGDHPLTLESKTPVEVERSIASAAIPPPSKRFGWRHGDDLDCIILTALQTEPERRYASAGQLGEDIGRFLAGRPVLAKPDTLAYRARRFVGRNRLAVLASALFAASLAALAGVAVWQAQVAAADRDAARRERDKAEKVVGVVVELFESSNPNLRPDGNTMSVRQFLVEAEPRVLERLQTQPEVRARLQQLFGLMHAARDQYAEARAALEQALAAERRLLGADHPEAIDTLYHLGRQFDRMGEKDRSRVLYEEALERSLRVFGEDHEKTARVLAALASESRLGEGRGLLEQALAIRRRVLPPSHPDIAENLAQLARYHELKGEDEQARRLYSEALAAFPTDADRRHPTALRVMNDFATLLLKVNEHAEAEALLRESLASARAVFGPDSFGVAQRLNNIGVNLASEGRHVEAEQMFRDAYERHVALLGETHWRTINVARNLGAVLALQRRYAEALSWLDEAIAALGPSPHHTSTQDVSLAGRRAQILLRLQRPDEAMRALESAIHATADLSRDDAARVTPDLLLYRSLALLETGRPEEAEAPARRALAALESLGTTHPNRAAAECLLGWSLVLTGRQVDGYATLDRCLPVYRAWGIADPDTVEAIDRLMAARPVGR